MQTKYTQGEWCLGSVDGGKSYQVITERGVPIADVWHGEAGVDDEPIYEVTLEEAQANGRLMACAPSLLKAAEKAYETSCRVPCDLELADALGALYREILNARGE